MKYANHKQTEYVKRISYIEINKIKNYYFNLMYRKKILGQ